MVPELEHYGIWAVARYAEVHQALRDWEMMLVRSLLTVGVGTTVIGLGCALD